MKLELLPTALNSTDEQTMIAASIYTESLKDVVYKDWQIVVTVTDAYGHAHLQAHFSEQGNHWTTHNYPLTPHMTKREILLTALHCVLAAEDEHAREQFLYKGKPVFGQRFDVDKLHDLCEPPTIVEAVQR